MEYKSKRHEEFVKDFIKNSTIVECLYQEGSTCEHKCLRFYDCWVKDLDEKDLRNKGKLEGAVNGI